MWLSSSLLVVSISLSALFFVYRFIYLVIVYVIYLFIDLFFSFVKREIFAPFNRYLDRAFSEVPQTGGSGTENAPLITLVIL